ncbi:MAG: hypothetical protein K8R69_09090, partial [Deltaproteobacteria bacterium]|nr:hypothetical protein [Deltaproteobacteria bacterium]
MKFLSQPIRAALLFAAVLFGLQSLQLLYAPSFYIASLHQVRMPPFMVESFVRHFALIAGLYLIWGLFLGSLNTLATRLADAKTPPTWLHFFGFFLLAASQSLTLYELIVWEFPSVLGFLPLFESQSLLRSYGVIAVLGFGLFLSAMLFLQVKRVRDLFPYAVALLLPALLHLPLMGVSSLELPQAARFSPDKPKVLLLGFDALDGDSGNPVIEARTQDLHGRLFNQAFTPLPSTHPAWHSVLSGLYPERHGVRFFFDSPLEPAEPGLYLQNRLKKDFGASTLFASDQPETSYFTAAQGFDASVAPEFGWRAHLTSIFLNQFLFPALWLNNGLVEKLWGYSLNSPSVFNYDLARFFNFSFRKFSQLPEEARFMALHSCHLHSPLRLRREELASTEGYLTLAPRDFSYWRWAKPGDPLSRSPARWKNPYFLRKPTTLQFLGDLIEELKAKHYFEGHRIAFLSDHGERFVE